MAGPLADARAAGVGHHYAADLFERSELAVAFNGVADLLRARGDGELRFGFELFRHRLPGHRSSAVEVFVGRVGAGADQAYLQLLRVAVFFDGGCKLRDRPGQVGRIRAVDVRFQRREVNLDDLVEVFFRVGVAIRIAGEVFADAIG